MATQKRTTSSKTNANRNGAFVFWIALGVVSAMAAIFAWSNRPAWMRGMESKHSGGQNADVTGVSGDYVSLNTFGPTIENKITAPSDRPEGMVFIPGGEFSMGCEAKNESLCSTPGLTYDAGPVHRVYVDPFWMDETEVTNRQFQKFVDETGYVTIAEITPTREEFPGAPEENLVAGAIVFNPTQSAVPLDDYLQWWSYVPGANWKHPFGPQSSIAGKDDEPVVQIAFDDAVAYCKWAGKRLPTEAEWEFAARAGIAGELYTWGNQISPEGKFHANIYQGAFPVMDGDSAEDGFAGVAPVKQYKPNGYGLYDMGGNVWELVSDWYRPDYYRILKAENKVARNPQGPPNSFDPAEPNIAKRVHRGGSFLCSDLYCNRYLLGTRGKGDEKSGSNHVGFRCVKDVPK